MTAKKQKKNLEKQGMVHTEEFLLVSEGML